MTEKPTNKTPGVTAETIKTYSSPEWQPALHEAMQAAVKQYLGVQSEVFKQGKLESLVAISREAQQSRRLEALLTHADARTVPDALRNQVITQVAEMAVLLWESQIFGKLDKNQRVSTVEMMQNTEKTLFFGQMLAAAFQVLFKDDSEASQDVRTNPDHWNGRAKVTRNAIHTKAIEVMVPAAMAKKSELAKALPRPISDAAAVRTFAARRPPGKKWHK